MTSNNKLNYLNCVKFAMKPDSKLLKEVVQCCTALNADNEDALLQYILSNCRFNTVDADFSNMNIKEFGIAVKDLQNKPLIKWFVLSVHEAHKSKKQVPVTDRSYLEEIFTVFNKKDMKFSDVQNLLASLQQNQDFKETKTGFRLLLAIMCQEEGTNLSKTLTEDEQHWLFKELIGLSQPKFDNPDYGSLAEMICKKFNITIADDEARESFVKFMGLEKPKERADGFKAFVKQQVNDIMVLWYAKALFGDKENIQEVFPKMPTSKEMKELRPSLFDSYSKEYDLIRVLRK